ncbi:MAG: WD40 repeat domain-containing protein [Thermoguttaceae bacterium]|nr:WD40 repeat domain-containing protein [Thermoguttaceae bacterium]
MAQEPEPRKLKIPEFQKEETTWWVQGRDTKSTSARRRARRKRMIWTVIAAVMTVIFGGMVLGAFIYWLCFTFGPKDCDLFTPKCEVAQTFTSSHTAQIWDMKYSPEGLFLITASEDNTAMLLDAESGEELTPLTGHTQGVTSLAVISLLHGDQYALAAKDKTAARSALRVLTGSKDKRATFWNFGVFPPTPQRLGDSENAWENTEEMDLFELPPGHLKAIVSVALSPDGRYALTGGEDCHFYLWDIVNRTLIRKTEESEDGLGFDAELSAPHNGPVTAVDFNPDGNSYVSGSEDATIKLWDSNSDALIQTFPGHNSAITVLQFSPNGKMLLSAGRDQRIILWNLITSAREKVFNTESEVEHAWMSPNGKYVIGTMYENALTMWDAECEKKVLQFVAPARITAMAVSPLVTEDGIPAYLAVSTTENQILIFRTQKHLNEIRDAAAQK